MKAPKILERTLSRAPDVEVVPGARAQELLKALIADDRKFAAPESEK
jgi:hypothetical protein